MNWHLFLDVVAWVFYALSCGLCGFHFATWRDIRYGRSRLIGSFCLWLLCLAWIIAG